MPTYNIEGQPARTWCRENGYGYYFVMKHLKEGLPIDEIKRLTSVRYHSTTMARIEEAALAAIETRKYTNTPEGKSAAKRAYFDAVGTSPQSDRAWEQIIEGTWEPKEVWKDIPGIPYQVSNRGRFRHLTGSCIVSIKTYVKHNYRGGKRAKGGMLIVKMNGKAYTANRLVAEAFVPKRSSQHTVVLPIDGNYKNIQAINLKWMTKSEAGKLTGYSKAAAMRVVHIAADGSRTIYPSARAAAKALYVSYQTVMDYCNGKVKAPMMHLEFAPGVVPTKADYIEHRAPIASIGK